MKRLTSILAISVIAVMSAGAARADIASTTYVVDKVSPVSAKADNNAGEITALKSSKENVANKVASGGDMEKALAATDADTKYPTLKATMEIAQIAAGAETGKLKELANHDTVSTDLIDNGAVTSAKILDGTIVNADIAANAAIATSKISGLDTALAGKQAKLTDAQLGAANSGITSTKVATYDGYDAKITAAQTTANAKEASANKTKTYDAAATDKDTKFPTISAAEAIADAKVAGANTDITKLKEDVAANKTAIAGKQATLNTTQLAAVNSGITSAKVSTYDTAVTTANNALPKATYDTQVGTVSAANMGTTATTVVGAIKEIKSAVSATDGAAVKTDQGATNKNKAVITDANGKVTTGEIVSGMIANGTIVNADIAANAAIATSKISGLDTALAGKQAKLTDAQLGAANSGITAAKVTTYDGYGAKITTAQNTANTAKTTAEAAIAAPAAAKISTDGVYTLTMKVVDGTRTYAWESIGR